MARGIDHVVHAVRDLDGAASLYRRLGFTVGARNKHPWGTHNYVVQLADRSFIELLTLAEPDKLTDDGFSAQFGRFTGDFLKGGEGLNLLMLESANADADARIFRDAGIAASEPLRFEREGRKPDGSAVKLAFSLAFARDDAAPDIHFATCQHHYPENFWNETFQHHHNSAVGLAGVVIVANEPGDHRAFLSAFADVPPDPNAVVAKTPRGEIAVVHSAAFFNAFGVEAPDVSGGARLAALRFKVTDIAAAEDALAAAEFEASIETDRIVVGSNDALGATIVFEDAAV